MNYIDRYRHIYITRNFNRWSNYTLILYRLTLLELDAKCMLALEVSLSILKILFKQSLKSNDIIQSQRSLYRHRFLCARKLQRCCSKFRWKISFNYRPGGGGRGGLGAPGGGGGLGAPVGGGGLGPPCVGARRSGGIAGLGRGFDSTSSGPSESHRMAVIAELNNIDKAIISH
jgi:hypothetical protein